MASSSVNVQGPNSPDPEFHRADRSELVKPGLEPLVNGLPGRVALLRGAGNAIVPQVAAELALSTLLTELSDALDQMPDVIATTSKVPKKHQPGLRTRLIEEFNALRHRLRGSIESTLRDLDTRDD